MLLDWVIFQNAIGLIKFSYKCIKMFVVFAEFRFSFIIWYKNLLVYVLSLVDGFSLTICHQKKIYSHFSHFWLLPFLSWKYRLWYIFIRWNNRQQKYVLTSKKGQSLKWKYYLTVLCVLNSGLRFSQWRSVLHWKLQWLLLMRYYTLSIMIFIRDSIQITNVSNILSL